MIIARIVATFGVVASIGGAAVILWPLNSMITIGVILVGLFAIACIADPDIRI